MPTPKLPENIAIIPGRLYSYFNTVLYCTPAAPIRFNPSLENEQKLMRDGTAKPVPRDQILRRGRGQGKKNIFFCSADDEQD